MPYVMKEWQQKNNEGIQNYSTYSKQHRYKTLFKRNLRIS